MYMRPPPPLSLSPCPSLSLSLRLSLSLSLSLSPSLSLSQSRLVVIDQFVYFFVCPLRSLLSVAASLPHTCSGIDSTETVCAW